MRSKKDHQFRIYGVGPHPIRTIYYRKLIKHGGSLAVTLPASIKSRWGAIRQNTVELTLWDSGILTVEPMEELIYESTQDRPPRARPNKTVRNTPTDQD